MENLSLAGMDAELQFFGQAEFLDGEIDHKYVFFEFLGKLLQVAAVIHAFVEAAGEFGCDGLGRKPPCRPTS